MDTTIPGWVRIPLPSTLDYKFSMFSFLHRVHGLAKELKKRHPSQNVSRKSPVLTPNPVPTITKNISSFPKSGTRKLQNIPSKTCLTLIPAAPSLKGLWSNRLGRSGILALGSKEGLYLRLSRRYVFLCFGLGLQNTDIAIPLAWRHY